MKETQSKAPEFLFDYTDQMNLICLRLLSSTVEPATETTLRPMPQHTASRSRLSVTQHWKSPIPFPDA